MCEFCETPSLYDINTTKIIYTNKQLCNNGWNKLSKLTTVKLLKLSPLI